MEPITSFVSGYIADKLIENAESAVRTHVIERRTRHRAREFFKAFCQELFDVSLTDLEVQTKLDTLLKDERRSAVVFEAYRAVCLTKSRNIGPRVIALLAAELVITGTQATEADEMMFAAVEELSDNELEEAASYVHEQQLWLERQAEDAPKKNADGSFVVEIYREQHDSNWRSSDAVEIGHVDLGAAVGRWSLKAKRIGLLSDSVAEKHTAYRADTDYHVDEDGILRTIVWSVTLLPACFRLASLIRRGAVSGTAA